MNVIERRATMKSVLEVALIVGMTIYATPLMAAGDAAAGKAEYAKKCASCHGQAGEGKEAIAKAMKVELKHLGSKEVQAMSDADLRKISMQGMGKMKPVKDIQEKSADDIVAYLRTFKQK
jgi:mono/diheme cytochrome c family protein